MGTPYVILASGQSNIDLAMPNNWSPNPRAKIFNNLQSSETSVGNAYTALDSTHTGISYSYASAIAAADPNKDVYLVRHALGGMDITHWIGGAFYGAGASGVGGVMWNNTVQTATQITISTTCLNGIARPYFVAVLEPGITISIIQGASVWKYQITGAHTWDMTNAVIPVSFVSGPAGTPSGAVQVAASPQFLPPVNANIPAALAAAGASKVDLFLWWQGESDGEYNTRYEAEFGAWYSWLQGRSWWNGTETIICGMCPTARNGLPWCTPFNNRLAAMAGGLGAYYANLGSLPASVWRGSAVGWATDPFHMLGAGYEAAGNYLFNSVYAPPVIPVASSTAKVRNGASWATMTTANTRVRNASNTGWVALDGSNFKVRGGSSWINPFSSASPVTITGATVSGMSTALDVTSNPNHQLWPEGPAGYGLWTDGFPNPYKDGAGNVYIPIPHSENFRYRIPNWNDPGTWVLEGPQLVSARDTTEGNYNNRHWVMGVWAEGNTVRGLAHHEWYKDTATVRGVGGFNSNAAGFNRRWVNAITWVGSSDGGATFATNGQNNSTRCVLVPEPWGIQSRDHLYGFFHPSNIVKEGAYYYAAVEQRSLSAAGASPANGTNTTPGYCADNGMSLIRTADLSSATGWQFWNGTSWETVNHNSWQGNSSSQVPKRFFQQLNHNFYEEPNNFNCGMGQSLRYHTPSGKWIMFGFTGSTAGSLLGYSLSSTLAVPEFNSIVGVAGTATADFNAPSGAYFSVFDPAATDQNFVNIGNNCTILVERGGVLVRKGTLTITTTT